MSEAFESRRLNPLTVSRRRWARVTPTVPFQIVVDAECTVPSSMSGLRAEVPQPEAAEHASGGLHGQRSRDHAIERTGNPIAGWDSIRECARENDRSASAVIHGFKRT